MKIEGAWCGNPAQTMGGGVIQARIRTSQVAILSRKAGSPLSTQPSRGRPSAAELDDGTGARCCFEPRRSFAPCQAIRGGFRAGSLRSPRTVAMRAAPAPAAHRAGSGRGPVARHSGEDEPRAEGRRAFDDDEAAQRPSVRQEVRLFQREMHRALRPIRNAQPPAQREVFARRADPSIGQRIADRLRDRVEANLLCRLKPDQVQFTNGIERVRTEQHERAR